jgi:hypothetical protein
MTYREVTVGRAPNSDILYDQSCVYVSNTHAIISSDGSRLIFKDISTNGTLINNMKIHHQSIVINYGDSILLAGKYSLTWNKIKVFFPIVSELTTTPYNTPANVRANTVINEYSQGSSFDSLNSRKDGGDDRRKIEQEISRWNWGAFFLYPYWGFANGMWWTFLIGFFFGWSFFPSVLFGICGSKWAWQNKHWRGLDHFISVQESWKRWGIGVFIIGLILFLSLSIVLFLLIGLIG